MVFVEFFIHLIGLDLGWLLNYTISNFLWLFMFAALAFYLWEGKTWIYASMAVFVLLTLEQDVMTSTGWMYLTGTFLTLEMLSQTALTIVTEDMEKLRGKIPLITTIRFLVLVCFYNLFLGGI
ncbi:MAG: hypothetical protein Q7S92_05585 [Candidatus Diapherotrites archaeon]|nr:hypothetical protein [Candidatus Diapherotrites archaeon]